MIKLLVTGANGQLGHELRRLLEGDDRFEATFTDIGEFDITDSEAIERHIANLRPRFIVNCAAYTAVDQAENDESRAFAINCHAVGAMAQAAASHGSKMIHISTDYIFDGKACRPYRETDTPNPVTAYGRTKLGGEHAIAQLLPHQAVILRTAWLYSDYGSNFVKTMLNLGRSRPKLDVVFDQVGTPTWGADLAQAIMTVLTCRKWHPGIYHYSNEGAVSWYDFAKAIHRLAGISTCAVNPCRSDQFPTAAQRPPYSVLDKSKFKQTFRVIIPHWEESLAQCIAGMTGEK